MIGQQHFSPYLESGFCHILDWWWNINNNISFHVRSFSGETNDNIFWKIKKNPNLVQFWTLFAQIRAKMNLYVKRVLPVFKYSNYLPFCKKIKKKLTSHSWEKHQTDGQTDKQWFYRTLLNTVVQLYIGNCKFRHYLVFAQYTHILTRLASLTVQAVLA